MGSSTTSTIMACVCGPIYKNPNFRSQFLKAKKDLELFGYSVTTPLDTAADESIAESIKLGSVAPNGLVWKSALTKCLMRLLEADEIWMLSGWENSHGALVEAFVAQMVGKPIFNFPRGDKIQFQEEVIIEVLRLLSNEQS